MTMHLCTRIALLTACITCVVALPINSSTDAGTNPDLNATTHGFEFSPNCSTGDLVADTNQSNSTYMDFAIGLHLLKNYLKGVRSELNMTIAMEDGESFVPCYPAPVDTSQLVQTKTLRTGTEVSNMAAWYGVLAAYAQYTSELLDDAMPPKAVKKLSTVFEMLKSVLTLFSDVIGPYSCTTENFEVPTYTYDNPDCTGTYNKLKYATNMISHLQSAVSDTREVQRDWYRAAYIGKYLNTRLLAVLRPTWISRYTTSC